jgi:hypothetical protein
MKSKSLLALAVASLFALGAAFAAEGQKAAPASKPAACCAAAAKDGKACGHSCCVEAAKNGQNCSKCGGSGAVEKKAEAKK